MQINLNKLKKETHTHTKFIFCTNRNWNDSRRITFLLNFFLLLFFVFFFFNNFTILYWFCHISTWIRHRYTRVPHPEPSFLPVPSLWVIPMHQPQASSIVHGTWTGNSFHTWYFMCFNAILPNLPTLFLSLSHRVQKTVLYISVSFAVYKKKKKKKNLPATQETQVQFLDQEDPLEKG